MIDRALTFIASSLDGHLARRADGQGPHAGIGALVDREGPVDPAIRAKVLVTLVNVERATNTSRSKSTFDLAESGETLVQTHSPIRLHLFTLMTATLDEGEPDNGYAAALARLSATIAFLHAAEVMTRQTHPDLPEGIERLVFELVSLEQDAQARLWSTLGGGYLPSVLYRVRMVALPTADILATPSPIVRIGVNTTRRS
ncbi:MAG: DUF4255 domain-containing protein [Pseudomonadota bacterium]